jgi:hypothetical protein
VRSFDLVPESIISQRHRKDQRRPDLMHKFFREMIRKVMAITVRWLVHPGLQDDSIRLFQFEGGLVTN